MGLRCRRRCWRPRSHSTWCATRVLKWKKGVAIPVVASFLLVNCAFFGAGSPKIPEGAWVPLLDQRGARGFVDHVAARPALRCESAPRASNTARALFRGSAESRGQGHDGLSDRRSDGVPFMGGKHSWIRERADEERVVLLTLVRAARPYVPRRAREHRARFRALIPRHRAVRLHERPRIDSILSACGAQGLKLDSNETSFFYADPKLTRAGHDPLPDRQRHCTRSWRATRDLPRRSRHQARATSRTRRRGLDLVEVSIERKAPPLREAPVSLAAAGRPGTISSRR